MTAISRSTKTYWVLVITLAFFTALSVLYLPSQLVPAEAMPEPTPVTALVNAAIVIFIYGGLGYVGLNRSRVIGFADIWDEKVSNRQRFWLPAVAGVLIGLFFILTDLVISRFFPVDALAHPEFPLSIVASITAAIGEEIIFRLFFIPFWLWLISWLLLKQRYFDQIFWFLAIVSALLFAVGHIPSVMALLALDSASQIPTVTLGEILLLNSVLSLPAAYYLRRYGFLAAVGIHFWTDVVWHVLYGLV
jgi:membrane protease YdiL (CAAX protease family)